MRVERGEECSYIKDIILHVLSHQLFPFFVLMPHLGGKVSLSLKEGSRFDSEMCTGGPPVTCLHSSLLTVPLRVL